MPLKQLLSAGLTVKVEEEGDEVEEEGGGGGGTRKANLAFNYQVHVGQSLLKRACQHKYFKSLRCGLIAKKHFSRFYFV